MTKEDIVYRQGIVPETKERLKKLIERIERLEEEKKALADDVREVFSEAKGSGFDIKIMKLVLKLRRMDPQARNEQDDVMGLYLQALDMD